jgi:hypothetical protein
MWRSKWFDLFLPAERVEAMKCIWGMMAYMMRKGDADGGGGGGGGAGDNDEIEAAEATGAG